MQAATMQRERVSEFFVYSLQLTFAETLDVIKIDPDSDFELMRLTMFAAESNQPQTRASRRLPLVELQILDTGSGRGVFEQGVSVPAIFGDGSVPFILPTTHWFERGTQARVITTGGAEVDAILLWINLIGRKRYERGPL
jgi:hypothetical protein